MKHEKISLKTFKFQTTVSFRIGSYESVQFFIDIPIDSPDSILDIVATGVHDLNGMSKPTPDDPQPHPFAELFWTTVGLEGKKVRLIITLYEKVTNEREYIGNLSLIVTHK